MKTTVLAMALLTHVWFVVDHMHTANPTAKICKVLALILLIGLFSLLIKSSSSVKKASQAIVLLFATLFYSLPTS